MKNQIPISLYKRRINRGVKWLDENVPGWLNKIDVRFLNLNQTQSCVCGQVFGDFWKVIYKNGPDDEFGEASKRKKRAMTLDQAVKRGFDIDGEEIDDSSRIGSHYDILTILWKAKLLELQNK